MTVYQSNRLEALVTVLSQQIKSNSGQNPFTAETILVHSPGMSEWLKIQIAQQLGIAANLKFPLPSSFIWSLYQQLIPNVPSTSAYNKDRLRWKIYHLLPGFLDDANFAAIKEYLSTDERHSSTEYTDLRRFQLSEKIADAYDNYLVYRPEWLLHWQNGNNDLPDNDDIGRHEWQAILWRGIYQNVEQLEQSQFHRASLHQVLLEKISTIEPEALLKLIPNRLFVFGISSLPSHQIDVLMALSQHIEVNILWFNPCSMYWGDILSEKTLARLNQQQSKIALTNNEQKQNYFITGNPLLASWGKVGRDYLDSLSQRDIEFQDIFLADPRGEHNKTLLGKVQQDILELEYRGSAEPLSIEALNDETGKVPLMINKGKVDDTIQIHSCHSRFRELEVLKDKLLGWLESNTILPKDILVMVPDINDYAPFIDAVFARDPQQPEQSIPYSISDRSSLSENPILNTFVSLLGLPTSRFTVSEVLDWLEVPLIMTAFNIDSAELELLKEWIVECEIKWALDGEHKANWNMPKEDINTWLYGLKRMVLGFSLGQESVWHGTASYTSIEGLNVNVMAKLVTFISYLADLKARFTDATSPEMWYLRVDQLITNLFNPEEIIDADFISVNKLREANKTLLEYQHNNDAMVDVNNLIVQHFFRQNLNETGVSQRFLAGRVNFCTLMPMRSVPFDIVCVLGLNDGEFPRHVEPLSFDLVGLNKPRKGDRARKLDERYLFLEAVCSARQKLHLSYLGQSSKNNQELMPSVLLSELVDYLQESFIVDNPEGRTQTRKVKDQIVIKHALQPFNERYFVDNQSFPGIKSYNKQWFGSFVSGLRRQSESTKNNEVLDVESTFDPFSCHDIQAKLQAVDNQVIVELDDLITFAKNPLKHFYKQQLGVNLALNDHNLSDVEAFEHDGLQRYKHVQSLVNFQQEIEPKIKQSWLASGSFPPKAWGEDLLFDYQQTVHKLDATLEALKVGYSDAAKSVSSRSVKASIEFQIANIEVSLRGSFNIESGLSLVKRLSKNVRADDRIEAWLIHLMRSLSDKPGPTFLLSHNTNDFITFSSIEQDFALAELKKWLQLYLMSTQCSEPIMWYGRFAYNAAVDMAKDKPSSALLKSIQGIIESAIEDERSPIDDHVVRHFGPDKPLPKDFLVLTRTLLLPLVQCQVEGKMKKIMEFMEEYVAAVGVSR
ncbi:exodeoxyribonuclease V subunit gamma [Psychrosphaera haliotis]|uniref:exodeoxyribonuclease V subunit gamma n=1 Tax=Psychrosphaera haliotis TaxID=555083 RepID=UPI0031D08F1B